MRLVVAAALTAAACGNTSTVSPEVLSPPDASSTPDASNDAGTLTAGGRVTAARGNDVAIAGARVCIDGHPEVDCGTTTADGSYAMQVPLAVQQLPQLAFVTTADGWLGEVNHFLEGDAGFTFPAPLLSTDAEATTYLATQAGFTYAAPDTTDGFIRIYTEGENVAGVTATITPATAKGAVYADPDGTPDPALTATSSSGVILFGNVAPGPFTITVSAPFGKTCTVHHFLDDWDAPDGQMVGIAVAGALSDDLILSCQ